MRYMQSVAQYVQQMNTLCFLCMSKLTPILPNGFEIFLKNLQSI